MAISATTIWNSATAGTDIAISNGLQVYATANPPGDQWCLTGDSISAGQKTYFEITVNSLYGNDAGIGVCNASATVAGLANNATYGCMTYGSTLNNGAIYLDGHEVSAVQIGSFVSNTLICIAVSGQAIYFRKGATGQWMGATTSADPVANTGGAVLTVNYPWNVVALFSGYGTPQNYTANFGNTAFSGVSPFVGNTVTTALPGLQANTGIGAFGVPAFQTLTGLQANTAIGVFGVPGFQDLIGLQANTGIGAFGVPAFQTLTGLQANTVIGVLTPLATEIGYLTGLQADAAIGTFAIPILQTLTGLQANTDIGNYGIYSTVVMTGLAAKTSIGAFQLSNPQTLTGLQANTGLGAFTPQTRGPGLQLSNLRVASTIVSHDNNVALRVSLDRGHSYGNPIFQSLGDPGQYNLNLSWRQIGQGRDAIFEIYWSSPEAEVLTGAFIQTTEAKT